MSGSCAPPCANVSSDHAAQGGSTLTMQLVRNLYAPESRFQKTLTRKIREIKLADQLEREHSKSWILNSYLNNVPYGTVGGQEAIGDRVGSAHVLRQARLEAQPARGGAAGRAAAGAIAVQPVPGRARGAQAAHRGAERDGASALHHAGRGRTRRAASPLGVKHSDFYRQRREQFFFDYVKQQLVKHYGRKVVDQGGLKVYTTINLKFQKLARAAIQSHLGYPGAPSGALATVDPSNGHILAMATSAQYGPTVFNYASQSHRQPGSTFKVIDLMAAVRMGIDPDATYYDSHELTPGWLPAAPTWHVQTDSHSYSGSVSLANALPPSDNTVFAQLGADIGPSKVDQAAHDMGITSPLNGYYAEAIGGLKYGVSPLEMADAYATVADGGWRNTVEAITRVVHPDGHVDQLGKPERKKEFTDGETAKVLAPMKAVLDHGTAAGQGIGCPNAGKTGTTSSNTDAWFVGVTPKLSTAVWVGYPNETRTLGSSVFGATIPAPIWHDFMTAAKGSFCGDWAAPKEPFDGTPFFGTYAGKKSDKSTTDTTTTTTTTPGGATVPGSPTTPGGKNPDPNGFAHPPQGKPKIPAPPQTQTPAPKPPAGGKAQPGPGGGAAPPTG